MLRLKIILHDTAGFNWLIGFQWEKNVSNKNLIADMYDFENFENISRKELYSHVFT